MKNICNILKYNEKLLVQLYFKLPETMYVILWGEQINVLTGAWVDIM